MDQQPIDGPTDFSGILPRPGHRGRGSGQLSASLHKAPQAPPLSPFLELKPSGEEEGLVQARAALLPKGSRPHPAMCPSVECDPAWKKMDGTVSTEEHPGKIQDAYPDT